jgi:hypothetical protein
MTVTDTTDGVLERSRHELEERLTALERRCLQLLK